MNPMTNAKNTLIALISLLLFGVVPASSQTSYTLSPDPYLWVLTPQFTAVPNGCVWTYQAGTTTAITTYADNAGTPNGNPIIADNYGRFTAYLIPGQSYKFVYENTPCAAPATHGTVLKTADNIGAVPSAAGNVDVPGVAGETLTAGLCVYLSDGSGSKNAGQWYKCDSTNTYSSTLPEVGMTTSSIASGATGQIRLIGQVTGLSGLTAGAEYFVSTAGAITATGPANKRHVGHADSTTSLILTADPSTPPVLGFWNDFRLTLATGECVTTTDQTAKGTIYYTPGCGPSGTANRITLLSSAGAPELCTSAEVSIAVPAATSQMYDVFAYDSTFGTCTVTLELLAWTNDTTRATAIAKTNGTYTKSGDTTRLYVGSVRSTGSANQTEDSFAKRYVWNYYNRVPRAMRVTESTDSWAYNGVLRQANSGGGANGNQLDFVIGVAEVEVEGYVIGNASGNASSNWATVSIGEDSSTAAATGVVVGTTLTINSGFPYSTQAQLKKYPAVGRHTWVWLEAAGAATTTWYGDNGGTQNLQSGIHGTIRN